jgi:PKD repeat protein
MRERSQASVIGFVLVFGIIISLLVILQVTAVPAWNQGIEVTHNERVQEDMESVREDILRTSTTATPTSGSLSLGTRYPVRPFLVNPPPPTGRLEVTDPAQIRITNATVRGETNDYWDGSTRTFPDQALRYQPDYNEYDNAPTTVLESAVLYNRFGERFLPKTETQLVSDRRITLVTLNGTLSRGGTSTANVELQPLSAPQQVTTVRAVDPLTLSLPTRLPAEQWRELLADERVANGGHVTNVSVTPGDPGRLRVTLAAGESYDLRLAKVGLGSETGDPGAHYITTESPPEQQVTVGNSRRVVFEVRDRYNNPISGVDVNATVSGPGSLTPVDTVSDASGRVAFRYDALGPGTATIDASFGSRAREQATLTVDVPQESTSEERPLALAWTDPVASGGEFTLDGGARGSVDLTATVTPAVEGVGVEYAVGDQTVGTLDSQTGTTDGNGQDTVRFSPNRDGTVDIYAIGAGSVDVVTVTVTNTSQTGVPTAEFTPAPELPAPGETVSFDGTGSSAPDGTVASYEWDFGDGTTATGPTPSHTYTAAGTYTVELTVIDSNGGTDTTTRTVTVDPGPSIDSLSLTDQSKTAGNPKYARIDVDYQVSDDIELDSLRLSMVRVRDGTRIADRTVQLSGTQASGTEQLRGPNQRGNAKVKGDYEITVTVVDTDGKTTRETNTVTVR